MCKQFPQKSTTTIIHNDHLGLSAVQGFEMAQRAAEFFACSSIVPDSYKLWKQDDKGAWYKNQTAIPNCFIAIDVATRISANPMLVMQNMYIVHGKHS